MIMKVARLENLILYSTVRDFHFVSHMRYDYFWQSSDVFFFIFDPFIDISAMYQITA